MYRPDPDAYAEICYTLPDGKIWRAVVFKHPDGWELRFGRTTGKTDSFMPAGTFQNSKALAKFIKAKVAERVPNVDMVKPIYNTLHRLKGQSAQSVVPDCYRQAQTGESQGRGFPECDGCPYRTTCKEPSAQPEVIPVEEVEEPEELFRHRLAQKMREKYGASSEKMSRDAAKKAFDALMDPAVDDVIDYYRDEDE